MDADFFENSRQLSLQRPPLLSPRFVSASLARDKYRIAIATGLMLLVALGVYIVMPPRYDAKASLLVLLSSDYGFRPEAGNEQQINAMLERSSFLKSEVQILTSPYLAGEVIHQIGLSVLYPKLLAPPTLLARIRGAVQDEIGTLRAATGLPAGLPIPSTPEDRALGTFSRALTAAPDKDGNTILVGFRHTDPELAARVVDTLVALYLQRRAELYQDVESKIVAVQAGTLRDQLDQAAQAYTAFKSRTGISDYSTQQQILLQQRGQVSMDLLQASSAVAENQKRLSVLDSELARTPADVPLYSDTRKLDFSSSNSAGSRGQIPPSTAGNGSAAGRANAPSVVRVGRNELFDKLRYDRAHVMEDLQAAQARFTADQQSLESINASIRHLGSNEVKLQSLDRDRLLLDQAYQMAQKSLDHRQFLEAVDAQKTANVRVIQPANVPTSETPIRLLVLAAGLMLTVVVGGAVAVLSGLLRRGYLNAESLERSLGVAVLSSVPELRGRSLQAFREGGVMPQ
jgi:uncharacterized protein involved in exopolysaccharide biosynthesis